MKLGHNSKTDLIKGVPLFSAASKQELAEIASQIGRASCRDRVL